MRRVMESVARANNIASNRIVFLDKSVAELDGSELGDAKVIFSLTQQKCTEITSETLPCLDFSFSMFSYMVIMDISTLECCFLN